MNTNLISILFSSNRRFPSERYKSHPERRYMASTIFGAKRFGYEKVIKTTMGNMRVAVYIRNKWYVCAIQNIKFRKSLSSLTNHTINVYRNF